MCAQSICRCASACANEPAAVEAADRVAAPYLSISRTRRNPTLFKPTSAPNESASVTFVFGGDSQERPLARWSRQLPPLVTAAPLPQAATHTRTLPLASCTPRLGSKWPTGEVSAKPSSQSAPSWLAYLRLNAASARFAPAHSDEARAASWSNSATLSNR